MRDVAIYAPQAGDLYGRHAGALGGGGAELQTVLLARGLAARGFDVAHIVHPVADPLPLQPPSPTLVYRRPQSSGRRLHPAWEVVNVWRALSEADARVAVVRGSGGYVVPAATWCRLHRRALVLATSSDLDFDLQRGDRRRATVRAYGRAARRASRLVVQTGRQAQLARRAFPDLDPIVVPSFAEPAEPARGAPEYFLWTDRLTAYKRPESYLELAAAIPEARFRMIVSETDETGPELRRRVHARAAELANVELAPRRSRPQLLAELERAVAVVKTSEVEGMPNTFLEAWARAVPVLSLSVDPDGRIAEHGGGLVAGGSPERFAEQARTLWADSAMRSELGARGREFVRARHSLDSVADRWGTLIGELLSAA
jgi:glycosyltransferase involved in cell wall biosynthesis